MFIDTSCMCSAVGCPIGASAADGFIHKPFDLDVLLDLIEHYIVGTA